MTDKQEKDLAQLSLEELSALAKSYGVTDEAAPEIVQLDALVQFCFILVTYLLNI